MSPLQTAAAAAQAAASRLAAAQLASKPTPVRTGVRPVAAAAPAVPDLAALRAMKESALVEIKGVAAIANPPAGAAAADRLGVVAGRRGKTAALQQQQCIPGMEPAELPKPRNKPQEIRLQLNVQESSASLAGSASSVVVNNCHAAVGQYNNNEPQARAINALDPNHASGFVIDLGKYNALLANGGGESFVGEVDDSGGGSSELSQPVVDLTKISDAELMLAVEHGLEAAGLGPEYASHVDSVRAFLKVAAAEAADYEAAERVAAEAERAECEAAERVAAEADRAEAEAVAAKVSFASRHANLFVPERLMSFTPCPSRFLSNWCHHSSFRPLPPRPWMPGRLILLITLLW